MFQFPGFASRIKRDIPNCFGMGCPIRISADRKLFAPPRSFSQLVTSFFASESLGILHTLLLISSYFILILSENWFISTRITTCVNKPVLFSRFSLHYMYLSSMSKNFIKYLPFVTGIIMQARFFNLCPLLWENRESNPGVFYPAPWGAFLGFVLIRQQAAGTLFSR